MSMKYQNESGYYGMNLYEHPEQQEETRLVDRLPNRLAPYRNQQIQVRSLWTKFFASAECRYSTMDTPIQPP